jgi:hypothetical protein
MNFFRLNIYSNKIRKRVRILKNKLIILNKKKLVNKIIEN